MIQLNAALDEMKNGVPFQIRFVTYNKTTDKGGEIINIDKAILCGTRKNVSQSDVVSVKNSDGSGHPFLVSIYLITAFNNKKIVI